MKKTVIYILLTLYIAVQLKPLTAVIRDLIAHSLYKVEHMATVHYENGRYHIHRELKTINDEGSDKSSQKSPSSYKASELLSTSIVHESHFNFNPGCIGYNPAIRIHMIISGGFGGILLPPPQIA